MVAMVAMIGAVIFTGCIEKEVLGTIHVDVTSSTWRQGSEPFDIYSAIKEKLEKVGFDVVANENKTHNATLLVDYKEEMDSTRYSTGNFPFVEYGYATNILCNLKLYDKDHQLLFVKEIYVSYLPEDSKVPIDLSISNFLYDNTLFRFERSHWFVCLGEIIAGKYSIGDEVPALITALEDEHWLTRTSATEVLGEIGDERAVEPLIDALKNDKASDVQRSAAEALGKIGDKRVVELLIKALKDEDWQVRLGAAIGLTGDKRAVEPLIDALKDEYAWVRERAAEALGKIGDERAVEPLNAVLEDKEMDVRTAAQTALDKIEKTKIF